MEMTSSGVECALDPFKGISARTTCRMFGNCYVTLEDDREVLIKKNGGHWMTDWAEYKYLDFAEGATALTLTVKGKGKIFFRTSGSEILGSVEFDKNEPGNVTAPIATVKGRCPLWLFMEGEFTLYSILAE